MYHGFSVCASVFSCIRFLDRGLAVWEPRTKYRLVSYKILPPPPSSPIQHLSLTGRTTPPPPDQSPSVASRPGIGVPGVGSGLLETEPLPSNNARTRGCSRCVVKPTPFLDRSSCDPRMLEDFCWKIFPLSFLCTALANRYYATKTQAVRVYDIKTDMYAVCFAAKSTTSVGACSSYVKCGPRISSFLRLKKMTLKWQVRKAQGSHLVMRMRLRNRCVLPMSRTSHKSDPHHPRGMSKHRLSA